MRINSYLCDIDLNDLDNTEEEKSTVEQKIVLFLFIRKFIKSLYIVKK